MFKFSATSKKNITGNFCTGFPTTNNPKVCWSASKKFSEKYSKTAKETETYKTASAISNKPSSN